MGETMLGVVIQMIQILRPVGRGEITLNHSLAGVGNDMVNPVRDGTKLDAFVRVDVMYLSMLTQNGQMPIAIGWLDIVEGGSKDSIESNLLIVGDMGKGL